MGNIVEWREVRGITADPEHTVIQSVHNKQVAQVGYDNFMNIGSCAALGNRWRSVVATINGVCILFSFSAYSAFLLEGIMKFHIGI